jgi:hypothetical protein
VGIIKRQVVYLIVSPLSKRDYDRFGIQRWLDRGWEVKVFDFTKFLKPEFWNYVDGFKLSVEFEGLKIFDNEKSSLAFLKSLENGGLFIDFMEFSDVEREIRQVAKNKGSTLIVDTGCLPALKPTFLNFRRIKKALLSPNTVFHAIIKYIRQLREEPSNYKVVGGTITTTPNPPRGKPQIITAHALDYDSVLNSKSSEIESNTGGLVFLDSNEPFHSDYVAQGIKPWATAQKYYPTMNKGLSQIAESLKYSVTIAMHPRCNYNNSPFTYLFPMLKDKTFELIKQANVVVSHNSTALLWAVILRKPIIIVTTNEVIRNNLYRLQIEHFAFFLGKNTVNLDRIPNDFRWESQLNIDETKYRNFVETYVKVSGSPEKPFWEIIIDRLEYDFQVL